MTKNWDDIASLQALYKDGKLKPSEVTQWYLERIEKLNPSLNAFLTVTAESALARAKELDNNMADLDKLPLFGVPVAFKDLYMTKGVKTTAGSKMLDNHLALYDATVVQKYLAAGAIVLGKLNCDAWAHGSSGENSDFGPTKNPWNLEYVPGGSSSGSAVAVAADLCLVAGGTDTGGSIRCPASFCSVVGIKPTYGRVSRYGIIAMASSLDSIGHFTKTVADSDLVLSVTSGIDPMDATSNPDVYKRAKLDTDIRNVKIGVPTKWVEGVDEAVKIAFEQSLEVLKKLGAIIVEIELPNIDESLAAYYIIQPAEVSSNLARFDGIRFGHDRSQFGQEAKRRIMLGTYTLSSGYYDAYYNTAQKVRALVIENFNRAFSKVDLIVAPVMPHLPFKIGEKVSDPLSLYLEDVLTVPMNLAGVPAISIPSGFSSNKLPIGLQIVGPFLGEDKIFAAAHLFEQATTWHNERPSI